MITCDEAYRCPGEPFSIARAIHLGRLAAFDPRCRSCRHRHDTGSLPAVLVEQLRASWQQEEPPLWDAEGASGLLGETLDADSVRRMAAAFGSLLGEQTPQGAPSVMLAGDGRSASAELVAAASDGLRWAGCRVIETPAATSACLLFTQNDYGADGALLVGNAEGAPRTASLRFFGPGGRPLPLQAAGGEISLADLKQQYERALNRPARRYGPWQRGSAEAKYLASLAGYFHALRPLKFVLDTSSAPLTRYLNQLLVNVGCRWISPSEAAELPQGAVHFGLWVDGDGERCRLTDEGGRPIDSHALLVLLAQAVAPSPGEAIVVESGTAEPAIQALEQAGAVVKCGGASRSTMHAAMREHHVRLGGGASGRFWFGGPAVAPDALHVLALLLNVLSRSDRPLSAVVR